MGTPPPQMPRIGHNAAWFGKSSPADIEGLLIVPFAAKYYPPPPPLVGFSPESGERRGADSLADSISKIFAALLKNMGIKCGPAPNVADAMPFPTPTEPGKDGLSAVQRIWHRCEAEKELKAFCSGQPYAYTPFHNFWADDPTDEETPESMPSQEETVLTDV